MAVRLIPHKIRGGEKIICPKCGAVIGSFKRDIECGEVIKAEDIDFQTTPLKNGEHGNCPNCGSPFAFDTALGAIIHTERGWMPYLVPLSDLIRVLEIIDAIRHTMGVES
jgi:ribosomal protein S27AE